MDGIRSRELRSILAQSLNPDQVSEIDFDDSIVYEKIEKKSVALIRREYTEGLVRLQAAIDALVASAEDMTDGQFDHEYDCIERQIDDFLNDIFPRLGLIANTRHKFLNETPEERLKRYQHDTFTPIESVGNLDEFEEKLPMYWIPKKDDVCRILFLAKDLHDQRVERQEAREGEPITIIDVGGANGALGRLCCELAEENNVPIRYTVVDPHQKIVREAQSHYKNEISFVEMSSHEYLLSVLEQRGDTETLKQLSRLDDHTAHVNKKYDDFVALEKAVDRIADNESKPFDTVYADICRIFSDDFSLEPPERPSSVSLWDLVTVVRNARIEWRLRESERLIDLRDQLEQARVPAKKTADLALNSWMPAGIDFTPDIRMLGAAGIVYIACNDGSTGIQITHDDPRVHYKYNDGKDIEYKPGDDFSYSPGKNYSNAVGWVGPSCRSETSYYEEVAGSGLRLNISARPLLNQIFFQVAKGYGAPSPSSIVQQQSIRSEKKYPWEDGLRGVCALTPKPRRLLLTDQTFYDVRTVLQLDAENLENESMP